MRTTCTLILPGLILTGTALPASPALAATADVTVTIPKIDIAAYHRPYVAIWLQRPGAAAGKTLALWYNAANRENGGQKWLRDLRGWWRKSGRDLTLPADGLTGATRAPGAQKVALDLGTLAPGAYEIAVEAAREDGGHELVTVAFTWNGRSARASTTGKTELGAVAATIRP